MQTTVPAALFVSAGGYHHYLGANTWHYRPTPVDGCGLSWFEVVVPGQDAFDAVQSRLRRREIRVTRTDDSLGVRDPDGIEVRIRV